MRAPVHDDGQIEAVFARLAKPVTAPGGAWVSQFSAVSERSAEGSRDREANGELRYRPNLS